MHGVALKEQPEDEPHLVGLDTGSPVASRRPTPRPYVSHDLNSVAGRFRQLGDQLGLAGHAHILVNNVPTIQLLITHLMLLQPDGPRTAKTKYLDK